MIIEWDDTFCTGDEAVDYEHKQLISDINRVCASLQDGPPSAEVQDQLGDLFAHISAHFALEEAVMRDRQYKEYHSHKEDHETLLDHIRDIMEAYEAGSFMNQRDKFSADLHQWFTGHFGSFDARLHRVLGPAHVFTSSPISDT